MATYKVIQDIEAEDKLLGPLTLRQFIFAILAVLCFYFSYLVVSKHAAFLVAVFLPPGLFAAFFAVPFGRDQPTEIWALAKLRFMFKPRKRIWDQSGVKELVTITVPKKVEQVRTNGLSQNEVASRLSALANTIDSRGWSIKNANVNLYNQPGQMMLNDASSDRLINVDGLPQEVSGLDIQAADDILDPQNNPIAQQFDQMITASSQAHRQQLMTMMQQPAAMPAAAVPGGAPTQTAQASSSQSATQGTPANYWFLNQPVEPPKLRQDQATFAAPQVVMAGSDDAQTGVVQAAEPTAAEEALGEQFKAEHAKPTAAYAHLKTIQPLGMNGAPQPQAASGASTTQTTTANPVTPQTNPAILELANNNDLNVATLARQAHKASTGSLDGDEVVIALH